MSGEGASVLRREVVVSGVGAVTPLGIGAEAFHGRWCAGESGIVDGLGRCAEFDPADHLTVKERRRTDRFTQLALAAAEEAFRTADWPAPGSYDPARVGCVIGTGVGGIGSIETEHDVMRDRGATRVSPLAVPMLMANAAPALISMRHRLQGPSFGTVSACASGAHAIGAAVRMVAHGEADACIAGGAESALCGLPDAAFARMEATSKSGISRPFDSRRDGFVMGEGAGMLIVEAAEQAKQRGAPILGRILGYGATSDAHHVTAPEPSGRGARGAIERALVDAGVEAADIDYVNAHGTSTQLNDRAETASIKAALGDRAREIPVNAAKSAIGHLLGAAGAVEAIATLLALRDRVVAPTLNYEVPEEGLDLDYVVSGSRRLSVGDGRRPVALSNSFGFGGHNAVLCLGAA